MFSRKLIIGFILIGLVAATFVSLALSGRHHRTGSGPGVLPVAFVAPLQQGVNAVLRSVGGVWETYFDCVGKARESDGLRQALAKAREKENRYREIAIANERLRDFLNFRNGSGLDVLAAEVVGKDPSPWFRTFIVNRGRGDGISVGMPVVVPDGIVGQVIEVSGSYAKVLLITDRMSGVDALVQRTRARGVVDGTGSAACSLSYALRRNDIEDGDIVVTSGLDRVYPKGLRIGQVASVARDDAGIFQEVAVLPFVDFERIEEVMILLPEKEAEKTPSAPEPDASEEAAS